MEDAEPETTKFWLKIADDMIFDFNLDEFTREYFITALHGMVDEFKILSQSFEEVNVENKNLTIKSNNCSCK